MKLYVCRGAPNPSKVRLYLAEKAMGGAAIELAQVFINLRKGEHKEPAHLVRNPLAKLPVLELDDGSFVTESLAIIEYLEECFPQPAMIGETALDRARVRELERIADLRVLLPVGRIAHATNSPLGSAASPEIVAHAQRILPEALRVLDVRLSDGREFLAGAKVSIADCTLAAAFEFARFGGLAILQESEHLTRWDARFRDRPSAKSVLSF